MQFSTLTNKDLKAFGISDKPKVEKPPIVDSPETLATSAPSIEKIAQDIINEVDEKASGLGALEFNDSALETTGFRALAFDNPYDLVCFYDKEISSGSVTLYPWQMEILESFGAAKCDKLHPEKFCLCANNGSGKDSFIITPLVVWLSLCRVQARIIITSASSNQLSSQTEAYIRNLCRAVNEFHGEEIFRIRQRYIYCRLTGSEIRMFATDEEGKAEGYHPITPNSVMAIVTNEGKSIEQKIYRALRRCTGYSYWLDVSSPGAPQGDFYNHFTKWRAKRVDYSLCPHSSEDERLEDLEELTENSSYYRSKWLALFTAVEGTSIIPEDAIRRNCQMSKDGTITWMHKDWAPRIGLDLAAGGDENSMYKVVGNKIVAELHFREKDTTITAARIDAWLTSNDIPKDSEYIFADDGGVGHAVIDQLSGENSPYKWKIARVNNQSPSNNKKMFINRGAQNWFRGKRLFESNILLFPHNETEKNQKLLNQLSSRFYKQQATQGRIALESKAEAKANGRPSPDRADAYILAFTGLSVGDFLGEGNEHKEQKDLTPKQKLIRDGVKLRSLEEIENWHQEDRYKKYQTEISEGGQGKPIKGSIRSYVNQTLKGAKRHARWN